MRSDSADTKPTHDERSLDPDSWEDLRSLGHRALDDMVDFLQSVGERPAWQPLPDATKSLLAEPLPMKPSPRDEVYADVRAHILPYPTNNIHPRFWSWVGGTGTPTQLIADMLISTMNSASLGMDEVASSHVELQLLDWLKSMFDYPADASGLLVSGGSMANLVGLAVARTHIAPYDVRDKGIDTNNHPRLIYYSSIEGHSSIRKGIELLGLGTESLRMIPVLDDFTIDLAALEIAIADDRKAGHLPACIIATAGTVNTGATDPLNAMADLAESEDMWLHVDAAFGGFAKLSAASRHLVEGMERADSLAFDLHKWLYVQYDCGCTLIRGDKPHKETFSVLPSYLRPAARGLASGPLNFSEYGVQLSRSFRALRPWMALKTEGVERYGEQIEQNIQQAKYLNDRVIAHPQLELLAPTAMNIVNFRYTRAGKSDQELDALNAEILLLVQERGIAAPSATTVNGRFSIRVAICNHRSRRSDFDALVEGVVNIGDEL
ncbi:MAG: amino acid decarboxylase [Gammaproteobacteria bacterium]|nr:amino acid decarboxylase [Gammaproteobacteria bacterium]